MRNLKGLTIIVASFLIAGCGGTRTLLPSAQIGQAAFQADSSATASGIVVSYDTGKPLAHAQVIIGALPSLSTCYGFAGCGQPLKPLKQTTTDAHGKFTLKGLSSGSQFLQVSSGTSWATLHEVVNLKAGANNLRTLSITALTADEQEMIHWLNWYRSNVATPKTQGNLVADEFAQLQVRKWANAIVKGKECNPGQVDPCWNAPANALPRDGGTVETIAPTPKQVVKSWFDEQKYCPHGKWTTCPWSPNGHDAGHYIILSEDTNTWIGAAWALVQHSTSQYEAGMIALGGSVSKYKQRH